MDENVLASVRLRWRKHFTAKKEKRGEQGCHAQQARAKAFWFSSPRDRIERYTFLCGFCSFPSLVYAPPADLIMSMPPETHYNNFFPLQWHFWWKQHWADLGSSSRFLELLWLLCQCELYRQGFATLKGENGSTIEENTVLCPIAAREKRQARYGPNTVFRVLSAFFLFLFLHWRRLFTLDISVLETKHKVSYDIKNYPSSGNRVLVNKNI